MFAEKKNYFILGTSTYQLHRDKIFKFFYYLVPLRLAFFTLFDFTHSEAPVGQNINHFYEKSMLLTLFPD